MGNEGKDGEIMESQNVTEALNECNNLSKNIMDEVEAILMSNDIKYDKNGDFEIVIKDSNKDEVREKLSGLTDVEDHQMKLLLQITESNNNVFIRQKFN